MKKYYVIYPLIAALLMFFVGAFYEWSLAPAEWQSTTRLVISILMAVGYLIGAAIASIKYENQRRNTN